MNKKNVSFQMCDMLGIIFIGDSTILYINIYFVSHARTSFYELIKILKIDTHIIKSNET